MDTALSVLAIVVGVVLVIGLALLILRLVDRFTLRKAMTPKQRAEFEQQLQQRLLAPQWSELEGHFGFAMPISLRHLYSDRNRLTRRAFYVVPPNSTDQDGHHFIARFEPADMKTLTDTWFPIGNNRFPFASDDFGNYFYVQLAPDSQEVPVFYVDHDGGDVSPVSASLADFLDWETYSDDERPTSHAR